MLIRTVEAQIAKPILCSGAQIGTYIGLPVHNFPLPADAFRGDAWKISEIGKPTENETLD